MQALPDGVLGPGQLLTQDLLLESEGRLEVYWIPFERLDRGARVAIIGLTPGWHQMQEAFTAARDAFRAGLRRDMEILEWIDRQAGFAGSMRTNMVKMLDAIGLPEALEVPTSAELFGQRDDLIHGTSALRYPVFASGKNYAGANPRVDQSPMLTRQVRERLSLELAAIPEALLLPLGRAVEGCLKILIGDGQLDDRRCLFGFPHPSGANGHRAGTSHRTKPRSRSSWPPGQQPSPEASASGPTFGTAITRKSWRGAGLADHRSVARLSENRCRLAGLRHFRDGS